MKILHINTLTQGGAAWCAIRISKALFAEGVESRMLFARGETLPDGVEGAIARQDESVWKRNKLFRKIKKGLSKLPVPTYKDAEQLRYKLFKANKTNLYLHQPLSNYKNIARHPLVEWADIIHLHWVPDFVDYPSFFKTVKKPIVWTLHDKYPAVGVQHYYSEFFPVPDSLKKLDDYCRKVKRKGVLNAQSLQLVAISEQMVDVCKHSDVLKGFPVTLIHNGVDTAIFHPCDQQKARKELGLISDAKIFLFSAFGLDDYNKGLDRVIDAFEKVNIPNKMLVCIGEMSFKPIHEASFPIILTGMLTNQVKVARYYSAADFFIQSSLEETFAQTPLEAMACGTPVISTPCSGASDLIRPFNGVLCDGFDSDAITNGIKEALCNHYNNKEIRQYIFDNYRYELIAKQYINLYESILS